MNKSGEPNLWELDLESYKSNTINPDFDEGWLLAYILLVLVNLVVSDEM